MSRKSEAYNFFEDAADGFICQVDGCGSKIIDNKNRNICSNLKRHLKRAHPDEHKKVQQEDERSSKRPCRQALLPPVPPKSKISDYFKSTSLKIQMSAEQFKVNIIDLVVRGGLSLAAISCEGMKNMLGDMASQLKVSLGRDSVHDLIMTAAAEKRESIKGELRNVPLYLKIDGCTRHNRSYLGVNAQFCGREGAIQVRTLAVRDCAGEHSAEHTKDMLLQVMSDYGITQEQVLAIVSDNAANMVKTVKLFNEEPQDDQDTEPEEDEFDEEEDSDTTMHEIAGSVSAACMTSHMRCAAHTLQLAVRDGIK